MEQGTDEGSGIIIDKNGDIIHTGYFQTTVDFDPGSGVANLTSAGSYDTWFGNYNPLGNLICIKGIGGPGADIGAPGGITIDNANNIYIAGNAGTACDYDPSATAVTYAMKGVTDWFVAKFNNSGNHLLSFTVGGTGQDQAHRLCTDNQQNIYVTGWFRTSADFNPKGTPLVLTGNCTGGGHDGYVAKYNPRGICLWAKQFGGVATGATALTLGTSVKLLNQGLIVFSGRYHGSNAFAGIASAPPATSSNGESDLFAATLDSAGRYQSMATGIPQTSANSTIVSYPNPAKDVIRIVALTDIGHVVVSNAAGQTVYSAAYSGSIEVRSFASGMYIVKLFSREGKSIGTSIFSRL